MFFDLSNDDMIENDAHRLRHNHFQTQTFCDITKYYI